MKKKKKMFRDTYLGHEISLSGVHFHFSCHTIFWAKYIELLKRGDSETQVRAQTHATIEVYLFLAKMVSE